MITIKSDSFYHAFQHSQKPIYAGNIKVFFDYGLLFINQKGLGIENTIAVNPREAHKLITAIELEIALNTGKIRPKIE